QDAQVYRKPGAAPDPDAGRSGGGCVCADAAYSRGHLRAPPRLRRHERQSARHRALSRRTRTRSPADRPVPGLRMGLLSPRLRDLDVVGQARGGRNCGAPADLARDRRDGDRDRHPHPDPARHYLGVEAEQLDRSRGAPGRHRGNRDAVVLARDRLPPGRSEHLACGIRRTLDAADRLCPVLAGSAAQPVGGAPARAYRRLPLLRRHYAHDPLGDARGPARGLYPDRPRERLGERLIVNRHALKNALLPVVTLIGIEFAFLIGGLVVTEQVFNINGVGRLLVLAIQNQDYTLTQALVMLTVAIFVLANLVVDLLYAWLDPRIRFA